MKLEDYIVSVPDFPEKGIDFKDITSLLKNPAGLQLAIDTMRSALADVDFDVIVGLESRGFIFGMPIAYKMNKPFVTIRKKGKLPRKTISEEYELEYGSTTVIEIHEEDIKPGQKVVIVDDLLATGGTALAAKNLVERLGGKVVAFDFLIELEGEHLKGREKLAGYKVKSAIHYQE